MLKIYNTLTRKKEEFKPQDPKEVKMYTCGVTVYDDCHIGHGRSLYIFEVMRKYLNYKGKKEGYKVKFVRNITDVDDKIINKARQFAAEKSLVLRDAFNEIRTTYIDRYYQDLKLLQIPPADSEPLATENIDDMIKFISVLIEKGFAYEALGNVYFTVRRLKSYGKLSGKKIDDLFESVRIDSDPLKKDPLDFALWKTAKNDEPYWESPWGRGRPGWHIECSVMSLKYLNTDTLDIHGGGRDLIFPHHENEVAQAQAKTQKPFANYWIHHGLITINSQKMAKSLGNFVTLVEVLGKYPADVLKLFYLQAQYASSIDFSWEKMEEAKKAYERIDILINKVERELACGNSKLNAKEYDDIKENKDKFIEVMDDDFNMPKGLAVLFDIVAQCNKLMESSDEEKVLKLSYAVGIISELAAIFGLTFHRDGSIDDISDEQIKEFIEQRNQARKAKNYAESDKIRKGLEEKGVILEDEKEKTVWRRKIGS
ncbi:MAG: cysteine--tRNA ligase [Candidatus Omnitrophota bacterium]